MRFWESIHDYWGWVKVAPWPEKATLGVTQGGGLLSIGASNFAISGWGDMALIVGIIGSLGGLLMSILTYRARVKHDKEMRDIARSKIAYAEDRQ